MYWEYVFLLLLFLNAFPSHDQKLLNPQCDNETLKPKGLEEELYVIGHFS